MEELTREMPVGPGFVPGDIVGIEMGSLRHRADLEEVLAVFVTRVAGASRGRAPREITLRGRLLRRPLRRRHPSEGNRVGAGGEVSRVTLSTVVPTDAMPGEYRCVRLEAETRTGRRVPFDPVTEAAWRGWRFRVQEEEPGVPHAP